MPVPNTLLLILLPGLDGTGKLFAKFIAALGPHVETRIIGYPTDEPLGYEELEARVRAALPREGRFVLLGESFGGPIAIRIAARAPNGLAGLILCGTFAKNPYPSFTWVRRIAPLLPVKSLPRWIRARLMWGSTRTADAPANVERAISGVSSAALRRRIVALLEVDTGDSLTRVSVPMLILYARADRVVPYAATQLMMAAAPDATIAPIVGSHLLLQATPDACAAHVREFLTRIAGACS